MIHDRGKNNRIVRGDTSSRGKLVTTGKLENLETASRGGGKVRSLNFIGAGTSPAAERSIGSVAFFCNGIPSHMFHTCVVAKPVAGSRKGSGTQLSPQAPNFFSMAGFFASFCSVCLLEFFVL